METPKTEISYGIICDKMPNPQSHYSTYELAEKWAKISLPFDEPMYIVKRTTTYEICGIIGKKKRGKQMTKEEIDKYVEMGDIENDEKITTERAIAEVYRWIRVVEGESYEYENLTPKVLDKVIQALSTESKLIPITERVSNFNDAVLAQELYKKIALMDKKSFNNFIEQLNGIYKQIHKSEEEE